MPHPSDRSSSPHRRSRRCLLRPGWVVAALLVIAGPARAQLTVYTDESSFLTAAQSVGTLYFSDDLSTGTGSGATHIGTLDHATLQTDGWYAFPNTNSTNSIDGTAYFRFAVSGDRPLTITFDAPVIAFGFEVNPRSQGVGDTFGVQAGSVGGTFAMPATDTTGFRGFVSTTPFSTFVLSDGGDATDVYGLDNLVTYSAVPEPGTTAAAFGALALLAAIAGRRRRAA